MTQDLPDDATKRSALSLLPWLALVFALSPALVSLFQDVISQSFSFALLAAPLLWLRLALYDRSANEFPLPRHRAPDRLARVAGVAVGLALLIEIIGIAGEATSVAHYSIPLAFVAMGAASGQIDASRAISTFWCVPVPTSLHLVTTPMAEIWAARLGSLPFGFLSDLELAGPLIRYQDRLLQLHVVDGGLHMVWLLALLTWYAWQRWPIGHRALLITVAGLVPAGFLLQCLATSIGIFVLLVAGGGAADLWIRFLAWPCAALVGFAWIESGRPALRRVAPSLR